MIVTKFGGTSVANAEQIKKVKKIVDSDPERKIMVVSAPGRDADSSYKVTDILYNVVDRTAGYSGDYMKIDESLGDLITRLYQKFKSISKWLGLNGADKYVDELLAYPQDSADYANYVISRGENFNARIIAEYLDAKFVDASDLVYVDAAGNPYNDTTMGWMKSLEKSPGDALTVIPGFYGNGGTRENPLIRLLKRGGSDFTGSLAAAGVNADMYENWTDKNGIMVVDPCLFDSFEQSRIPVIDRISYREIRELSYSGATILNDETIGPVRERKIPVNVKNTNNPEHPGTMILQEYDKGRTVVGIAGRNGFVSIEIEKYLMNKQIGFGKGLLEIFSEKDISYEHIPSGIDNVSLIIDDKYMDKEEELLKDINSRLKPDSVKINKDLALIAVVGEGMKNHLGIDARVTKCLADNNINIEIITKGASESNMIIGVKASDYKKGIRSLYEEFFR